MGQEGRKPAGLPVGGVGPRGSVSNSNGNWNLNETLETFDKAEAGAGWDPGVGVGEGSWS